MSHSALLLDDDDDLRETLAEVLRETCQLECIAVASVGSMIAEADRVLRCETALIDINLGEGEPSGLDAYRWLLDHGFTGRIIFLTGHAATHGAVRDLIDSGAAGVLQKPTSVARLRAVLEEHP